MRKLGVYRIQSVKKQENKGLIRREDVIFSTFCICCLCDVLFLQTVMVNLPFHFLTFNDSPRSIFHPTLKLEIHAHARSYHHTSKSPVLHIHVTMSTTYYIHIHCHSLYSCHVFRTLTSASHCCT